MPTAITIRKGKDGGFYNDDKTPIIHQGKEIAPEEILLKVGAVETGLVIPLDTSRPLLFKNIDGKTFCATIDPDNHFILAITRQSTGIDVDEVEIDQESQFWFFVSGIVGKLPPKQT